MKIVNYAAALGIVALIVLFLVEGRALLVPLAVAIMVWFLIDGLAGIYQRIVIGGAPLARWIALTAAGLTVLGVGALIVLMVSENVASVAAAAPEYQRKFEALIERLAPTFGIDRVPKLSELLKQFEIAPVIGSVAGTLANLMGNVGLVLVYLLFIFVEQAAFEPKFKALFPDPDRRERIRRILREINEDTRKYIRLKTAMSALTGVFSYVVLSLVGVDYAAFWAFIIFLLNFIPTIGSIIGIMFPALLTLVQFETIGPFLIVSLGLTSVQIIIDNVVEPRLMGGALNLSSLAVLLSLAIWGSIWGIVGMFLSVPIMVIMMIIFANFDQTKGIAVLLSADGNIKGIQHAPARF
ncbi:AI-2E family transporter [Iodidimonas sp. SYSU 1G8]|uniref:AI-2E family transporter n=1 Tax=Iodidimonas sp. SYSU 1G8 TaxID=3133967 RepID=UPI0031FEE146